MANSTTTLDVNVSVKVDLQGRLSIPDHAKSVILFAHGRDARRSSSQSRYLVNCFNHAGIATLLFDLLTDDEEDVEVHTPNLQVDFGLLTERIVGAIEWIQNHSKTQDLQIGLFGIGALAAPNLVAAAEKPDLVSSVVCCGGRPDLVGGYLAQVEATALFVVGGLDPQVIEFIRNAAIQMPPNNEVCVVAGATHSFEEEGTLEKAGELARDWYLSSFAAT